MKQIKGAMGTEPFPQLLFDKVFKDDVLRLRSMEEMWKIRRPPEPLDFSSTAKSTSQENVEKTLKDGQRVWDLHENVSVFRDRYRTSVYFLAMCTDNLQSGTIEQENG